MSQETQIRLLQEGIDFLRSQIKLAGIEVENLKKRIDKLEKIVPWNVTVHEEPYKLFDFGKRTPRE